MSPDYKEILRELRHEARKARKEAEAKERAAGAFDRLVSLLEATEKERDEWCSRATKFARRPEILREYEDEVGQHLDIIYDGKTWKCSPSKTS